MSNEPTCNETSEIHPDVHLLEPAHLVPGTAEAAIADWSASTWALVVDRENRQRAARTAGAR